MKIIIPLAGPNYLSRGVIKGQIMTSRGPLLRSILESRPWFNIFPSESYVFIFLEHEKLRTFFYRDIKKFLPKSQAIFLSKETKGAALSALNGLTLFDLSESFPLLIDLADISFSCTKNYSSNIFNLYDSDVLINTFISQNESFSFAQVDKNNIVKVIKEKIVISNKALVGTYFFRSFNIYLKAIERSLNSFKNYSYNDLLFISPILNSLICNKTSENFKIKCIESKLIDDYSTIFH